MTSASTDVPYLSDIDYSTREFAECYDELPLWSAPFGLMMLQHLPLRPDMAVLDVGAGTGFLSIELAQRCGPGSRVIAVDPWAGAMQRLRRKLDHLRLANVELMISDAASLALADNTIDLIVSNLGINNFDNATSVLATCFRVARPGGCLALTTNLVGHMQGFYDVYRESLRACDLDHLEQALDRHVGHRATDTSLKAMLHDAGFVDVNLHTDQFALRFANGTALLNHSFMRVGFMPAWKALVPAPQHALFFRTLEQRLNDLATRHGDLGFNVPMAYVAARKP